MNYYQTIPELGIKGRMNTPEEFEKIGLPEDLTGKDVLDIGCNIGAFMLECLERGAFEVEGVEPNILWRLLAKGVLYDYWNYADVFENIKEAHPKFDLVLLLSATHVAEGMTGQELLDRAWDLVEDGGLMIVEINDRLQKEDIKLPKEAVKYGINKDNRTVWHCRKV